MDKLNIREADSLEVTILADNYTDILLTESTLKDAGSVLKKSEKAEPIAGELIYTIGTVERKTAFERR